MSSQVATDAVVRLAKRDSSRTEADVQADVYLLLTAGGLNLDTSQVARLEVGTGDGTRRRIDVEIGHCVIELKRDLRVAGVRADAEDQLAGYVQTQTEKLGSRYVGVLTDGTDWFLYRLHQGVLVPAGELRLNAAAPDSDRLLVWLEAILATQEAVKPSPVEIERRLGAESPAHELDHGSLKSLYEQAREVPEVALKRNLWAKLLRTAFGKAFDDDESLFIDHTLLVLTAEIIAHAVIGFDISRTGPLTPQALASGTAFSSSQIHGVVEADFFDWVLHTPGGPQFVVDLADRVARFDWSHVEHDVLKLLYESVITQQARASLGEYYTPDWLADRMVNAQLTDPLNQRALDPGCGSGTFVFHAARAFLDAADAADMPNGDAILSLTRHVFGMDVHPVAVTLARVTYLLAIGASRLAKPDRGPITVPIYLGDSLQWEQRRDLLSSHDVVTISTAGDDLVEGGGGVLFGDDLVFPRSVLQEAATFDQLVTAMADRAADTSKRSSTDVIRPVMRQFGIHETDVQILTQTFDTMRRLQKSGRNHIWGYYVRNLIRPLWLAEPQNQVDVLIGNPPWLRYSKMLGSMQQRYKTLSSERGLLSGSRGASGRDLSTLFVARAVELYLKPHGRFSFVMPHGALTRKPHDGFRSGKWNSIAGGGQLTVTFGTPWDLTKAPTGFPMVSCVIFGERTEGKARAMPTQVKRWVAKLKSPNTSWSAAADKFSITDGVVLALATRDLLPESPYRKRFRQGAVLAPRVLLFAVEVAAGPLGAGAGRIAVESRRTNSEKKPWKRVASIRAKVERTFVRPIHLGETLLPYRLLDPLLAVLPVNISSILLKDQIDEQSGLSEWWAKAEQSWKANKVASDESDLLDRIDYHGQLSAQLPATTHRVAYTASGTTLAAARVEDQSAIIEHKLYWAAAGSLAEARYLVAVLNSQTVLDRVKPLQNLGLFGPRDFDKTVFHIPIPTYEPANSDHKLISSLAGDAEKLAATIDLTTARTFKKSRILIRAALETSGLTSKLEAAIATVIPPVVLPDANPS
jgi:hypothetical protein